MAITMARTPDNYKKSPKIAVTAYLRQDMQIDGVKVDLLEEIDRCGTISKAARKLDISYRQALYLL